MTSYLVEKTNNLQHKLALFAFMIAISYSFSLKTEEVPPCGFMLQRIHPIYRFAEDISDVCTLADQQMLCTIGYPSLDDKYYCGVVNQGNEIPSIMLYLIP